MNRRGFLKTIGMGAVGAAAVAITSCVTDGGEGDWDGRPWVDKRENMEPPSEILYQDDRMLVERYWVTPEELNAQWQQRIELTTVDANATVSLAAAGAGA